jgi:glycosyltransferase involved in cell wall biosynthesis
MRLAILATHPIQYFAPWFQQLATCFDLEVLYAHPQDPAGQSQAGFGVNFDWDVPLLEGYRYRWLKNVSRRPGLQTFGGCDTPELFDRVHPNNYDALLVLGWNRKSFVQGIRAAWRNKVPILARGDSQLRTERSLVKRALKFLPYRWFLPRIDAHLYVGTRNRQYLRHYGVRGEQLFFSPHFVDNDFFATRAEQARKSGAARAIREQFGIPSDACVALFVGKFILPKRPGDFLLASLRVTKTRKHFHALLVGDGPLRKELEALASADTQRIHFAGFHNQGELPAFYAAANILVLPGDETWGLVVNEAMACGLPAIVSDAAGCVPDMIDVDLTGATFPLADIAAFANRLINFRGGDGDALRRKCESYSMQRATEGLHQALGTVLAHKG